MGEYMKMSLELIYDLTKINDAIKKLHALENRAIASSDMKFRMQYSEGEPKTSLLEAYSAVTECAAAVAAVIGNTIGNLEYAKSCMLEEDNNLKRKMTNHTA